MAEPLLNPHVLEQLQMFARRPSHALLISGNAGMGHEIAGTHIVELIAQNSIKPLMLHIAPTEKQHITIEQVRELRMQLRHRNSSGSHITRVIVINPISSMTDDAQNALLKIIEEPGEGVLFVLYSYDAARVLSTIRSRCTGIQLLPISPEQASKYFNDEDIAASYKLSQGYAELLLALQNNSDHPLATAVEQAKIILTSKLFDRLAMVEPLAKKKEETAQVLEALTRICSAGLHSGARPADWLRRLKSLQLAKKRLAFNVQAKLVLDELFASL